MGIPSYFRKIVKAYPNCIVHKPPVKPTMLCFDFNCLIYRCLRTLPPYSDGWEKLLLKEVASCIKEVWQAAGKPSHVYIGVDGVVPMAKIRQQRVRRFKSAWQRDTSTWDTNAITPGTEFMENLTAMLHKEAAKHGNWVVSGSDEPGEGEHKILSYLRGREVEGPVIVYGLDADLILLTMLISEEKSLPLFLLREKQEFGGVQAEGPQEYSLLSIQELKTLVNVTDYTSAINYIGLMSLMGNDFLPHSLTHKLSDDGHDFVIRELRKMKDTSNWLIDEEGGVTIPVLRVIFAKWAKDESYRMEQMIHKKQDQARRGILKGMNEMEGLPLQWNVEAALIHKGRLRTEWKDIYWGWMNPTVDRKKVCEEYIRGFKWILDYYTGKNVNKTWMYPYWIPPLWSDLADIDSMPSACSFTEGKEPQGQEQLAMVLPLSSWGLIRDPELRTLPVKCPQLWPLQFSFFSAGRKWLWECEALIPVLTAGRLRHILKREV
jgi:5'-3' exonuclease